MEEKPAVGAATCAVAARLSEAIDRSGLSRTVVAQRAGMASSDLTALLAAKRPIDTRQLYLVCMAVGVNPGVIVDQAYRAMMGERAN